MCEYDMDSYRDHQYGYKDPKVMKEFVDYLDKYTYKEDQHLILVGTGNSACTLGTAAILLGNGRYSYYDGVKHLWDCFKDWQKTRYKIIFIDDCIATGTTLGKMLLHWSRYFEDQINRDNLEEAELEEFKIRNMVVFRWDEFYNLENEQYSWISEDCFVDDVQSGGTECIGQAASA